MAAINAISGLITNIPGTNQPVAGPLEQGGFGPDYLVELNKEAFGDTAGARIIDSVGALGTGVLSFQAAAAHSRTPIFNAKQAREIQSQVLAAASAIGRGDLDEASTRVRQLLKRDHNDPIAHHLMGRIASARGDLPTAAQHFQHASELDPGNARFQEDAFNARQLQRPDHEVLELGRQLTRNRATALGGVRLLFELAGRSPAQGQIYAAIAEGFAHVQLPNQQLNALEVALSEAREGDLPEIESAARAFIRDHEPVGLIHSILGRVLQRMGRFDEAISELETARRIAPEVHLYTAQLANVYATRGNEALGREDLSAAEHNFTIAHDLDIRNADISLGLAAVHVSRAKQRISEGLDARARADLGRATALLKSDRALNDEIARAYMRLGNRAQAAGQTATALEDYKKAHQRSPDLAGVARTLAGLHVQRAEGIIAEDEDGELNTGQHEDVIDHRQAAFDLTPLHSGNRQALASALNEFGLKLMNDHLDYERALEMFHRARDLFPDDPTYLSNWQQAWHLNQAD